jgi:methionyl-tRNA synthetase
MRHRRVRDRDRDQGQLVAYACKTTKLMSQALEEGVTPLELCTKFHQLHTEIYE